MKDVIIYTSVFCPYCHKALRLLTKKGVPFTNIDVAKNRVVFDEIMTQTGWDSVPQIFIDGKFVGGCDDIHLLDAQGKLDELLEI